MHAAGGIWLTINCSGKILRINFRIASFSNGPVTAMNLGFWFGEQKQAVSWNSRKLHLLTSRGQASIQEGRGRIQLCDGPQAAVFSSYHPEGFLYSSMVRRQTGRAGRKVWAL